MTASSNPLQADESLARLAALYGRIAAATERTGRAADSVQLLAVSKVQPIAKIRALYAAGQRDFGENYVQELEAKVRDLSDLSGVQWHLIGPVQSNKTRVVAECAHWVHSVDRLKIAERLSEQRSPGLPALQVCLQVNVDGGASKSGVTPDQALTLALAVVSLPRLCLRGIMSIPEPSDGFEAQKAVHLRTKALFDDIANALAHQQPASFKQFNTLSRGMSADMASAIAAGVFFGFLFGGSFDTAFGFVALGHGAKNLV